MPARKSASPEAAQKKLWAQEIKSLETKANQISRNTAREIRLSENLCLLAARNLDTVRAKHVKLVKKVTAQGEAEIKSIQTRLNILRGRVS